MPFDIVGGLFGLGREVLGGLLSRRQQQFMPGQVILPPVEVLRQAPPIRTPQLMQGRVMQAGGCSCTIQRQLPARIVNMRGTPVIDPSTNQVIGCTPRRRQMNPLNSRAATRAATRLMRVSRFQKRIQKAIRKACISPRGGVRMSSFGRKKACK